MFLLTSLAIAMLNSGRIRISSDCGAQAGKGPASLYVEWREVCMSLKAGILVLDVVGYHGRNRAGSPCHRLWESWSVRAVCGVHLVSML